MNIKILIAIIIIIDIFLFLFVQRAEAKMWVSAGDSATWAHAPIESDIKEEVKVKKPVINGEKSKIKNNQSKTMTTKMNTKVESVTTIYDGQGHLVAIVKRDDLSKKSFIYIVRDAKVDDIARIINGDSENEVSIGVSLPKTSN